MGSVSICLDFTLDVEGLDIGYECPRILLTVENTATSILAFISNPRGFIPAAASACCFLPPGLGLSPELLPIERLHSQR